MFIFLLHVLCIESKKCRPCRCSKQTVDCSDLKLHNLQFISFQQRINTKVLSLNDNCFNATSVEHILSTWCQLVLLTVKRNPVCAINGTYKHGNTTVYMDDCTGKIHFVFKFGDCAQL